MKGGAKKIALVALMAATLEAGKLALSSLANIEVVTLFTALYAFVFGFSTCLAVVCFVLIETAIYGIMPWVASYLIHWNVVAIVFAALGKRKINKLVISAAVAVILTALFGVLTSLVDLAFTGFSDFFARFAVYYMRGVPFYAVHVVSNGVLFALFFKPLSRLLDKFKNRFL